MRGKNRSLGQQSLPSLPLAEWESTKETLHRYTQIVGKVRLEHAPYRNHWWHVPLYVSTRGLTTSPIPYGDVTFEISFDSWTTGWRSRPATAVPSPSPWTTCRWRSSTAASSRVSDPSG